MQLLQLISNIHWIAVIGMTIFSFVLGAAWHSKLLFGKPWSEENHPGNVTRKMNVPFVFAGTAVMHFLAIATLSAAFSGKGSICGLLGGFIISICLIVPAMSGTYLFANRSIKLLAIDSGMYIILFTLTGLMMGSLN